MKKILTLIGIAASLFFVSCSDDDTEKPGPDKPFDPQEITVVATTLKQGTRVDMADDALKSIWTNDDMISLFVNFKDEWETAGNYNVVEGSISNDMMTAKFAGKFKWQANGLPQVFYGYSAKKEDANKPNRPEDFNAIPITLPEEQQQDGVGVDYLGDYNFMIARPVEYTSPLDASDPAQNKDVAVEFQSVFSIVEFRIASFKEAGMKVKKVVFESDNRDLAVADGTIDITNPYFDTNFGKVVGGTRSNKITLDIANPVEAPISSRKSFIPGNSSLKPVDLNVAVPARFVVLPNVNMDLQDPDREEKWTVTITAELPGLQSGSDTTIVKEFVPRITKPGERHAIPFVAITTYGEEEVAKPDTPGEPWTGNIEKPAFDETKKIVTITKPSELAWVARAVNHNLPAGETPPADPSFRGYTLKIVSNLNLGGLPWEPIGLDEKTPFTGSVEGIATEPNKTRVYINGLNVNPEYSRARLFLGLFGYIGYYIAEGSTPDPSWPRLSFKGVHVNGDVKLSYAINSASTTVEVGALIGQAVNTDIENCESGGNINVIFDKSSCVGGICGYPQGCTVTLCDSYVNFTGVNHTTNVTAFGNCGGVVGGTLTSGSSPTLRDCSFSGSINLSGQWVGGGVIGQNGSKLASCKNTGNIYCEGNNDQIGGVTGRSTADIIACYNRGNITVADGASRANDPGAGGIVGVISSGRNLKGCYTTGRIDVGLTMVATAGQLVGKYSYVLPPFNFTNIQNNYFLNTPMESDLNSNLENGQITQFSPASWPNPTMDGWQTRKTTGTPDLNAFWNEDFPASYGVGEYEYPQLHWEKIE